MITLFLFTARLEFTSRISALIDLGVICFLQSHAWCSQYTGLFAWQSLRFTMRQTVVWRVLIMLIRYSRAHITRVVVDLGKPRWVYCMLKSKL